MKKHLVAVTVFTIALFLWSGFTQILPWGIPTAQKISTQSKAVSDEIPDLIHLKPGSLVSNEFEPIFNHKISTYTTDNTFSWIITQPLKTNYSSYLIGEVITQFFVAILLTLLLVMTKNHTIYSRMMLIAVVGLLAWGATYGQLLNWWAMPSSYAIGVGVNLLIGWLFTGFLVSKFVIKSTHKDLQPTK